MNQDYELLTEEAFLKRNDIIIYGAGNFGRRALNMLSDLGAVPLVFCDKNPNKWEGRVEGVSVVAPTFLDDLKDAIVIIAMADYLEVRQLQWTFSHMANIGVCTFQALERLWYMRCMTYDAPYETMKRLSTYAYRVAARIDKVAEALKAEVLVWQSGKVGSSALFDTLSKASVSCAHLHKLRDDNDGAAKRLLIPQFVVKENAALFSEHEVLMERIKERIIGKKIIILVRNPIEKNLSGAFHSIGDGMLDAHFNAEYKKGAGFMKALCSFVEGKKGVQFNWFENELEAMTGCRILDYPFDKEKGYAVIRHNTNDILLMRTEKMDGLCDVISDFVGVNIPEILHANVGQEKWYGPLYSTVKESIRYSEEYVSYFTKDNPYMEHFFTEDEIWDIYEKYGVR